MCMWISGQIDSKTDDIPFERAKRIMTVQNISGQFTARKIDGAAQQQMTAFKIANWSARNPALLWESLKLNQASLPLVAPDSSMR